MEGIADLEMRFHKEYLFVKDISKVKKKRLCGPVSYSMF